MLRFDEFTQEAQDVTQRAVKIIQVHGHGQLEVEHILLAMLELPHGSIPRLLETLGVQADRLAKQVNESLENMPKHTVIEYPDGGNKVFISARVRDMLTSAALEARQAKADLISSEHMLLAILNGRKTPAPQILGKAGITRERVEAAMKHAVG